MRPPKRSKFKTGSRSLLIIAILALIVFGGVWSLRHWYFNNLRPVSSSQTTEPFAIDQGDSVSQISLNLKNNNLIRSTKAFQTYVRSKALGTKLQAGTYSLSPSMSVQQIVDKFVKGDVSKNLLTILPGKRVDQIEQTFIRAGYSQAEVDTAFDPATYTGDALLSNLPSGASLEGFLYPDSFQRQANTPASSIVKESLDEMQSYLTSSLVNSFGTQGLSVYQAVTLASIVEQESGAPTYQPEVAQVFLLRLKDGMMLGSDVTAFYASALAGEPPSVGINSPYNTRLVAGLPPGPIGNVTASALNAVAHPSNTDYLYFVAGDDGTLHFSHTVTEHNQAVQQYCTKACQ